jgi:hypothetical protein
MPINLWWMATTRSHFLCMPGGNIKIVMFGTSWALTRPAWHFATSSNSSLYPIHSGDSVCPYGLPQSVSIGTSLDK